jgi:hypothetical protein
VIEHEHNVLRYFLTTPEGSENWPKERVGLSLGLEFSVEG